MTTIQNLEGQFDDDGRLIGLVQQMAGVNEILPIQSSVSRAGNSVDLMNPASGVPVLSSAGRAISFRSNGAPLIASGGVLTSSAGAGQRAWYSDMPMPAGCKRIRAEIRFRAGSGGRNGAAALIPWRDSVTASANIPPTPAHLVFNRWGWSIGNLPNTNGTITNYKTGRYNKALDVDKWYTVELSLDGGKAYILLPDGTTAVGENPAIADVVCAYPGVEFYQFDGATDDVVEIRRAWFSDGDQAVEAAPAMTAGMLDIPRRPTALQLTSLTSTAIGTSAAIIDSAAVCPVYSGPTGAANVICRFTGWVNLAAGRSLILAPRFVDIDGGVVAQPYMFGYTAPDVAAYAGPFTLEMVQAVASSKPVNCQLWANSAGPGGSSGDSFSIAANKPITMQFIPLG